MISGYPPASSGFAAALAPAGSKRYVSQTATGIDGRSGDVVLMIGTTKGAFLLSSDAHRASWEMQRAQDFIQQILEEEVTALRGREKSERKAAVDAAPGYRNGYGKARQQPLSSGTITCDASGYGVWRNASRVGR